MTKYIDQEAFEKDRDDLYIVMSDLYDELTTDEAIQIIQRLIDKTQEIYKRLVVG